jgi:hypothetical protein
MIDIKCIDNQNFKLTVLGYQFPAIMFDEYDSNWLRIHIVVDSKLGKWESVDCILLTWEMEILTSWLNDIYCDREDSRELDFIEPNLSFKLLEKENYDAVIRINFNLESKPKSALDDDEYYIDFKVSESDWDDLIHQFTLEQRKFDYRKR